MFVVCFAHLESNDPGHLCLCTLSYFKTVLSFVFSSENVLYLLFLTSSVCLVSSSLVFLFWIQDQRLTTLLGESPPFLSSPVFPSFNPRKSPSVSLNPPPSLPLHWADTKALKPVTQTHLSEQRQHVPCSTVFSGSPLLLLSWGEPGRGWVVCMVDIRVQVVRQPVMNNYAEHFEFSHQTLMPFVLNAVGGVCPHWLLQLIASQWVTPITF